MADYYSVLGLDKTADIDAVKKKYRTLVKGCHPDFFPNNEAKKTEFLNVQQAYDMISDGKGHYTLPGRGAGEAHKQKSTTNGTKAKAKKPKPVVHINLTMNTVANYTGGRIVHNNRTLTFDAGVIPGNELTWDLPDMKVVGTVKFRPSDEFRIVGHDLYGSMTLKKKLTKMGSTIRLSNHPKPGGQYLQFTRKIRNKETVVFSKAGLMSHSGDRGDLYLTITFKSWNIPFVEWVSDHRFIAAAILIFWIVVFEVFRIF